MNPATTENTGILTRRTFLGAAAAGTASALGGQPADATAKRDEPFDLAELTIADLQAAMKSGRYTARQLAEKYLNRIGNLDKRGPAVNSIIELNADALAIAEGLDNERKAKGPRGPLHGIPILLKDNIDTADRMHTSAASLALADHVADRDAFLVQKLRRAGAVLLGKCNLSEWANFRSTRSASGWSGRGGLTRNPYALDRNPCGSSSGSAVALAANFCSAAVGTETDGSIVCPAAINGVVGLKPTVGLISRSGIIPISHSQDTAGPMARTVTDAAILLGVMTGIDESDPATAQSAGKAATDYTAFLDPDGLCGARIGVARRFFGYSPHVDAIAETALDVFEKQGATLIDPADLPTHGRFGRDEFEVLLFEFKADLNLYLSRLGPGASVRSLTDLIEFNQKHRAREMPYFGQELFELAEAKPPLTEQSYQESLERCRRLARTEGIDAIMDKHQLDAIVAPTTSPAWTTDLVNGDHSIGSCSEPAAVAGYPHVTVPAGFAFGLPIGISLFGRAFSEGTLLKLAFAFEQATKHRRPPTFLATADLAIQ